MSCCRWPVHNLPVGKGKQTRPWQAGMAALNLTLEPGLGPAVRIAARSLGQLEAFSRKKTANSTPDYSLFTPRDLVQL